MSKNIIENLLKVDIKRTDIAKAGLSVQKYDDILRGKSNYNLNDLIELAEKFQLDLDFLVYGESNAPVLSENDREMLSILHKFNEREQIKFIGRAEQMANEYLKEITERCSAKDN